MAYAGGVPGGSAGFVTLERLYEVARETELLNRAHEIAAFLGIPEADALERLSKGFGYNHQMVNDDWRRCNPVTDEEILNWYRTTDSYIFELTAYHLDPGFNYSGMCSGIAERLKSAGKHSVLSLGDGVGDLTLTLKTAGFDAVYHDLAGSRTAEFATDRYRNSTGRVWPTKLTTNWEPVQADAEFDAIVSLDFMEHVTCVDRWAQSIFNALRPGGLFCACNAFAIGSGAEGSIPCHLAVNDKYAYAVSPEDPRALWDKLLLDDVGFVQLGSNWYQRPA